jgi:uncharacterized protein (TIGR02285 family)
VSPVRFLLMGWALFGLGSAPSFAEERPAILWMLTNAAPKVIPDGPLKGTGYAEQQAAYLAKRLPQFDHRVEIVTATRLWHEMQAGKGICSIDIAELPERENWALFTRSATSAPSYSLLVLRERVGEFAPFRGTDGTIDLERLGAGTQLTGLYAAGRHYTPQINAFIDSPTRKTSLLSTSASTNIFEMVASRRGDFAFGAMTEMNYFNASNAALADPRKRRPPLAMLTIKGAGEPIHGHIACTRDPLGRQMIQTLDRLFDDPANWNDFIAPQRHWLDEIR